LPPDERTVENLLGPQLVIRLNGVLRSARIYDVTNQAVQTQIQQLMETVAALVESDVALLAVGQHFYVSGIRIKPQPAHLVHFGALQAELAVRGLGGLRFLAGVTTAEVEAFLRVFAAAPDLARGLKIPEAAVQANIRHIVAVRASDISMDMGPEVAEEDKGRRDERARARRTFWRAVSGSRAVVESTARTGKPAMRLARRVIQPLVDTLMKEEYSIIGLAALKNHDEYTYAHCVNVSVLSIAIGHRLGFSRSALANLGVAALLHDVGKLVIPPEVLNNSGKLTREEWSLIQRHPLEGVKLVSRLPGLAGSLIDAMRVCLQHHRSCDGTGYPESTREWRLSTFSRIVSASDCYDAMTAHRTYRARPMTGYEALQQLLGREAARFDPTALSTLVHCVGLYPAGTVMLTTSGHKVMSLSPNPSDALRPFCEVLSRPDGLTLAAHETVTWDPMPPTEAVVEVMPPETASVDVEARLSRTTPGKKLVHV
jgi:HD-GYP domain-containing protein (c-di-GMP phosphodiesterase class II)